MYCQKYFEEMPSCDVQCEHCGVYYFPVELESAGREYGNSDGLKEKAFIEGGKWAYSHLNPTKLLHKKEYDDFMRTTEGIIRNTEEAMKDLESYKKRANLTYGEWCKLYKIKH